EPTNHLDLWACDALEQALLAYEGTVIVVSHDRYFLNRVVDLLIALDGEGNAQVIHGNYDTYEMMRAQQDAARTSEKSKKEPAAPKKEAPARRSDKPPKRKRQFPYRKVEDLEAEIAELESLLADLEQRLASPELYRDGEKVKETTRDFESTRAQLQQLY